MNEEQVIGSLKSFAGKVQENFGKLIGSESQSFKGLKKQTVGDAQRNYGESVEAVKNARKRIDV